MHSRDATKNKNIKSNLFYFYLCICIYELSLYLSTNQKIESKINVESMKCFSCDCMNNSLHPNHNHAAVLYNTLMAVFHGYKV